MSTLHNFKERLDIIIVFFLGLTRHSDVVEVGECIFQFLLLGEFVHKSLKHRNTIGHTKWYTTELVQLSTRFKCSIFPLYLRYRNLMIGIICRKHFLLGKFVDHGVDTRQWVCIVFSIQINCLIIVYALSLLGRLCTVLHNNYLSTPW